MVIYYIDVNYDDNNIIVFAIYSIRNLFLADDYNFFLPIWPFR